MSKVKDSAGSTKDKEIVFINIEDKAVNEAIKEMYLDFKLSPIRHISFEIILKKISSNKKISLGNASILYYNAPQNQDH